MIFDKDNAHSKETIGILQKSPKKIVLYGTILILILTTLFLVFLHYIDVSFRNRTLIAFHSENPYIVNSKSDGIITLFIKNGQIVKKRTILASITNSKIRQLKKKFFENLKELNKGKKISQEVQMAGFSILEDQLITIDSLENLRSPLSGRIDIIIKPDVKSITTKMLLFKITPTISQYLCGQIAVKNIFLPDIENSGFVTLTSSSNQFKIMNAKVCSINRYKNKDSSIVCLKFLSKDVNDFRFAMSSKDSRLYILLPEQKINLFKEISSKVKNRLLN